MSFLDETGDRNKFYSASSESYVTTGRSFVDDHLKNEIILDNLRNNINGSEINILYQNS